MNELTKVCPECGVELEGRNLIAHALSHYPEYLDPAKSSKKARERQKLILAGGVTKLQYLKTQESE